MDVGGRYVERLDRQHRCAGPRPTALAALDVGNIRADHQGRQLPAGALARVGLRNRLAGPEDRRRGAEPSHLVELVADEQHAGAVLHQPVQGREEPFGLLRGEDRRRLVQDQELWRLKERAQDLDSLALSGGEAPDRRSQRDRQAVARGQSRCLLGEPLVRSATRQAERDILERAEVFETGEVLEHHRDAEPARLSGIGDPHLFALPADGAGVRLHSPKRIFTSVDLPAPFSPSSACRSPSPIESDAPSFAAKAPKRFVIPSRSTRRGSAFSRMMPQQSRMHVR